MKCLHRLCQESEVTKSGSKWAKCLQWQLSRDTESDGLAHVTRLNVGTAWTEDEPALASHELVKLQRLCPESCDNERYAGERRQKQLSKETHKSEYTPLMWLTVEARTASTSEQ